MLFLNASCTRQRLYQIPCCWPASGTAVIPPACCHSLLPPLLLLLLVVEVILQLRGRPQKSIRIRHAVPDVTLQAASPTLARSSQAQARRAALLTLRCSHNRLPHGCVHVWRASKLRLAGSCARRFPMQPIAVYDWTRIVMFSLSTACTCVHDDKLGCRMLSLQQQILRS